MYNSNPSNILQINWKKEFNLTKDKDEVDIEYSNKIQRILKVIQKSVQEKINNSVNFSQCNIDEIITLNTI
jgi:uncharacterized alkaline shock family protein YloU